VYNILSSALLSGGPGFEGWQLGAVIRALCASPYGAVFREDLAALVGAAPLAAMLRANLLGLRPQNSPLARDMPAAAWQGLTASQLVGAASSVHMFVMRQLVTRGEIPVKVCTPALQLA
jgi:hypothetical protein